MAKTTPGAMGFLLVSGWTADQAAADIPGVACGTDQAPVAWASEGLCPSFDVRVLSVEQWLPSHGLLGQGTPVLLSFPW